MESIFTSENEVVFQSEQLLARADGHVSAAQYAVLLDDYKHLLRQMQRIVSMSDRMQSDLKKMSKLLEKVSNTDPLTGLFNRRFFNDAMQKEWDSAIRSETSLAALMIDVDHLKQCNDLHGPLAGDLCLQEVANCIKMALQRPRDTVARFNDDEFIVVLPETDLLGAICVADGILQGVRGLNLTQTGNIKIDDVTVSIGLVCVRPQGTDSLKHFLFEIDGALYRAKNAGCNCWSQ